MTDIDKNDPSDDLEDFLDDDLLDAELDALGDDDDITLSDDAFDDEEWDSLDDDALEDGADEEKAEKSFLSRHFNMIIIIIAVLLGGIFIFNSVLKQPAPTTDVSANTAPPEEEPIDLGLESLRDYDDSQEAILPYQDEISALSDDEAGLNTAQFDNSDAVNTDGLEAEDDLFADLGFGGEATPEDALEADDVFALVDSVDDMPVVTEAAEVMDPLLPLPSETQGADLFAFSEPSDEFASIADPVPANDPGTSIDQMAELERQLIALNAQIEQLSDRNTMLEDVLASKDQKTAELENAVEMLENQLNQAKKPVTAQPTPKVAVVQKSEPAAIKAVPVVEKIVKPKPRVSKPKAPTWIMRSAQQGQAVLANASTGDLLKISVGDSVPGLGRIKSIRFDTGRWIVDGSQKDVIR